MLRPGAGTEGTGLGGGMEEELGEDGRGSGRVGGEEGAVEEDEREHWGKVRSCHIKVGVVIWEHPRHEV